MVLVAKQAKLETLRKLGLEDKPNVITNIERSSVKISLKHPNTICVCPSVRQHKTYVVVNVSQ